MSNMDVQPKKVIVVYDIFTKSTLTKKVFLKITEIGKNTKQNLEKAIGRRIEGKCISEGFIRVGSIQIISYSAGNINGDLVEYVVVFDCYICNPVEGQIIEDCLVTDITKAGIHAEKYDNINKTVPLTIFLPRDYYNSSSKFNDVKESDKISVVVLYNTFELNDPYVTCFASLYSERTNPKRIGGENEIYEKDSSESGEYIENE